jgi:hypothetical protein
MAIKTLTGEIDPFSPDLEAGIRKIIAANPFINFIGIDVPQLGRGQG